MATQGQRCFNEQVPVSSAHASSRQTELDRIRARLFVLRTAGEESCEEYRKLQADLKARFMPDQFVLNDRC